MNKMYIITPIIGIEMNSFFIPFSIHISIISFIVCFIYDFMPFLLKKKIATYLYNHMINTVSNGIVIFPSIYIMYSLHLPDVITQSFILSILTTSSKWCLKTNIFYIIKNVFFLNIFIIYIIIQKMTISMISIITIIINTTYLNILLSMNSHLFSFDEITFSLHGQFFPQFFIIYKYAILSIIYF